MLNTVNYVLPMLGLVLCIAVTLIKQINTRGAICTAKLHLYALGWLILIWADWGTGHTPVFATVLFRLIVFINNLFYIKQLTLSKPISFKTLWPYRLKH